MVIVSAFGGKRRGVEDQLHRDDQQPEHDLEHRLDDQVDRVAGSR